MRLFFSVLFSFLFFSAGAQNSGTVYDYKLSGANGGIIDLSAYHGKKILIVNAPVESDFNRQYGELEALYQKYKNNLVIVGILADDFQIPPGVKWPTSREKNYNVTFPMAARQVVGGKNISPIYKWLTEKQLNHYSDNEVKWDFHKYLINENGELVAVFDPKVRANDPRIISAIEK